MSLLSEIEAAQKNDQICSVARLLDGMDEQDRKDLETVLADPITYSHNLIARVLVARGHKMHPKRISQHRKAECVCYRQ